MDKAAQQVMQANQMAAQGMGQSIEQQTIQLQKDQLMLDKEKLDLEALKDTAEMQLKNRELNLKEDTLKVQTIKEGSTALMKAEEKEKDRIAKETENALNTLMKVATVTVEDDTKKKLKLADIKADFAKEEERTARDIELENIKTHRDERLGGEE